VRCLRRTEAFGQIFFDEGVGTKFDARMRLRNLTMEYVINLSRKLLRPIPRLDPPPILTAWISGLKYLQEVGHRRLPLRSLLQHQERNARLRTQPPNPCKSPCCLHSFPGQSMLEFQSNTVIFRSLRNLLAEFCTRYTSSSTHGRSYRRSSIHVNFPPSWRLQCSSSIT
jgi:hypothetical protein